MPTFTDAHGVRIHYKSWRVPDAIAVVQLVHGIGEHIGRYGALIEALNAAGYSVWADDHRGHGQTGFEQHGGDLDRMGRPGPGGMRASIAAVGQFSEVIRDAEGGDVPLVILGHSWGSLHHAAPGEPASRSLRRRRAERHRVGATGMDQRRRPQQALRAARRHGHGVAQPGPGRRRGVRGRPLHDDRTLQQLYGWPQSLSLINRPSKRIPSELPLLLMVGSDDAVGR